ncbi:MAG: heavy-metal-associated domain-containing protein [Cyclobacteriaceae bacterium]
MEKQYTISGMTCGNCVVKVKNSLEALDVVQEANISLESPNGILVLHQEVDVDLLQSSLDTIGDYKIGPLNGELNQIDQPIPEKSVTTYKPLILVIAFITGVSLLAQYPFVNFSFMLWMRHFMAGFFIVFAFFKLLNLKGFADAYRGYDLVAAAWNGWGFAYPFVELTLGLLYLTNTTPFWTNVATVVILGISSIGVIKSNLKKQKIKCACLGDVFALPMSTVTIIEDLAMVAMAAVMLLI